jgi:tetratricopeptide (TPR) repeat protein
MVDEANAEECPADLVADLVAVAGRDGSAGLARLDILLKDYGGDARLHFLRGSLLAAAQDYGGARVAMQAAVDLAPGYAVARFQLGLLELSSGDGAAALATLQPLEGLPADNPLRLFALGLQRLAADDFDQAIRFLREGVARNTEIPAMNKDMTLIIDEAQARLNGQGGDGEPMSQAHFLLQQYANKSRKP